MTKLDKKPRTSPERLFYASVHVWLRKNYGKATRCSNPRCKGESKNFSWALIHRRNYGYNANCFRQLCRQCHTLYDFTEETIKKLRKNRAGKPVLRVGPIDCSNCGTEIKKVYSSRKYCKECAIKVEREQERAWILRNHERSKEIKRNWYHRNRAVL